MTETLEYLYTNHLNSIVGIAEETTPNTVTYVDYTTWGYSSNNKALFTGKELDNTGLYCFNARYYDPVIGRFLQEDPSKQGLGWYNYCGNDPINRVDRDGRKHDGPGNIEDTNYSYIDQESSIDESSFDELVTGTIEPGHEIKNNIFTKTDDFLTRFFGALFGLGPNDHLPSMRGVRIPMAEGTRQKGNLAILGAIDLLGFPISKTTGLEVTDEMIEVMKWTPNGQAGLLRTTIKYKEASSEIKYLNSSKGLVDKFTVWRAKNRLGYNTLGTPGKGTRGESVKIWQEFSTEHNVPIALIGSRSTNYKFRYGTDQDIAIIGSPEKFVELYDKMISHSIRGNIKYDIGGVFSNIDDALNYGAFIIMPK